MPTTMRRKSRSVQTLRGASLAHDAGRGMLHDQLDPVSALEAQMLAGLTKAQAASLRRNLHACLADLAGR